MQIKLPTPEDVAEAAHNAATMSHAELIADIKAKAAADPFILSATGTPIKTPSSPLNVAIMFIDGVRVQVGFTYDLVPELGTRYEHLSIHTKKPAPRAVVEKVKALAFGTCAHMALLYKSSPATEQWLLIHRDLPAQRGFSA